LELIEYHEYQVMYKKEHGEGISLKLYIIKKKHYSRVPRLLDTRYSAKGTKGKWKYASSKARFKCATYP